MKIALVVDWPAIDATEGKVFSEWEWQVTKELMEAAGLEPSLTTVAFPLHLQKWDRAWKLGKIGGALTEEAEVARQQLIEKLRGFDMALTMGSHAMFCLTGETKIDTYRGTHIDSPVVEGLQVVPTYAPGIYARMAWSERPIVLAAMKKVQQRFVDVERAIYVAERIEDLYWFSTKFIKGVMSFDVETNSGCRVTEFSISPSPIECLYVQLEDRSHRSIWSAEDELQIMLWLHWLCQRRDLTWVMHNSTFDLSYMTEMGLKPLGPIADTMLRHHAFQAEWEKSLGFLASLHLPTRAWKHLRTKAKKEFNKAGAL